MIWWFCGGVVAGSALTWVALVVVTAYLSDEIGAGSGGWGE